MKKLLLLFVLVLLTGSLQAQKNTVQKDTVSSADSLLNSLNPGSGQARPVIATFKSTRLILSQTTETNKKKNLNFIVVHRFGDVAGVEGGGKTLYGFDNSSDIYISFEYGLTDSLDLNFGRSKYEQLLDLSLWYLYQYK